MVVRGVESGAGGSGRRGCWMGSTPGRVVGAGWREGGEELLALSAGEGGWRLGWLEIGHM